MTGVLQVEARNFASRLTGLIQGCIPAAPVFGVIEHGDPKRRRIGPEPFSPVRGKGFSLIRLPRTCDGDLDRLMLKIEFSVAMDDESEYLAVRRSEFGLWVRPEPEVNPRPVLRIEFDRDARTKPPAHVHFHAESSDFNWIYESAGLSPPRLSEIHFPVGGRRFRPSIEELLRFLHRENLFVDWLPDWQRVVDASFDEWDRRQARATVRRHPQEAAEQLRELGFEVRPPA